MIKRGFQAKAVMDLTGVTYRQIDHWVRSKVIVPSEIIKNGNRSIRVFSFNNLVVIRAAKELLDYGIDLAVVKNAAAWLQNALEESKEGQYLFAIEENSLKFVSDDPKQIMDLIRGECVITINIRYIINQLNEKIACLEEENNPEMKAIGA